MIIKLFSFIFLLLKVILAEEENAPDDPDMSCDAIAVLSCPGDEFLPAGLGSRSPFFNDVLGVDCTNMKQKVYDGAPEVITASSDGGFALNVRCPDTHPIISEFSFCFEKSRVREASLTCVSLVDNCVIQDTFSKNSNARNNQFVHCGGDGAVQGMHLMEAEDMEHVTEVAFDCAKVSCVEGGDD